MTDDDDLVRGYSIASAPSQTWRGEYVHQISFDGGRTWRSVDLLMEWRDSFLLRAVPKADD